MSEVDPAPVFVSNYGTSNTLCYFNSENKGFTVDTFYDEKGYISG